MIEGDKRGRELGFPTANIASDGAMLPPHGVYAAWVTGSDETRRRGIVNIGVRPTFKDGDAPMVEVHLLDFEGDLYGQHLCVELSTTSGQRRASRGRRSLNAIERCP